MSGFEVNRFVGVEKRYLDNLLCSICLNIFNKPVVAQCGHTFCAQCIHFSIETNGAICPQCRDVIGSRKRSRSEAFVVISDEPNLKTNYSINALISVLMIKCDFESNGCSEVIELSSMDSHLKTCDYNFEQIRTERQELIVCKRLLQNSELVCNELKTELIECKHKLNKSVDECNRLKTKNSELEAKTETTIRQLNRKVRTRGLQQMAERKKSVELNRRLHKLKVVSNRLKARNEFLETTDLELRTRIEELETNYTELETHYNVLEVEIEGLEANDTELREKNKDLEDRNEVLETTKHWLKQIRKGLKGKVSDIEDRNKYLRDKVSELEVKCQDFEVKNKELELKKCETEAKCIQLKTKCRDSDVKNGKLELKSGELEVKNRQMETKSKEYEHKNWELEVKTSELETKISKLENKCKDLEGRGRDLGVKKTNFDVEHKNFEIKIKILESKNRETEARNEELSAQLLELRTANLTTNTSLTTNKDTNSVTNVNTTAMSSIPMESKDTSNETMEVMDISQKFESISSSNYILFGTYRTNGKSFEFNAAAIRLKNVSANSADQAFRFHVMIPYIEMNQLLYCSDPTLSLIFIKPNAESNSLIQKCMNLGPNSTNGFRFDINSNDLREQYIIIHLRERMEEQFVRDLCRCSAQANQQLECKLILTEKAKQMMETVWNRTFSLESNQ